MVVTVTYISAQEVFAQQSTPSACSVSVGLVQERLASVVSQSRHSAWSNGGPTAVGCPAARATLTPPHVGAAPRQQTVPGSCKQTVPCRMN
jgi:hypothetical protein